MAARNKLICTLLLSLFTWGVYDVIVNVEQNDCAMTYMFEYPKYIPVPGIKDEVKEAFPRYSLYLYGEGDYAKRSSNMKLQGIPVLFIPGNAGSYKQVRSLGSVALRKAERYSFHFNYFSVDLDGELVGMYGGFLHQQTEYVAHCIEHILSLYQHLKNPPQNVILVGHSMGGLVARSLFLSPNFNQKRVHTIITQATPHDSSVVKADKVLDEFQIAVNKFWQKELNNSLSDVVLLSVGGGFRDNLVRSGLTSLNDVFYSSHSLSVVTSSIPNIWLSTDHLCVVWCKELVMATNRAMFEMVDKKTKQISTDPEYRMKILKKHFSSNNDEVLDKTISFAGNDKFEIVEDNTLQLDGVIPKETTHYMFPLKDAIETKDHFVAVGNMKQLDWASACVKVNGDHCTEAISLKSYTQMMPPRKTDTKKILLPTIGLKDVTHFILKVTKGKKAYMSAELFNSEVNTVQVLLPGFQSFEPQIVLNETTEGSTFHKIYLDDLYTPGVAYKANLDVLSCDGSIDDNINSTLHFYVPWNAEDVYSVKPANENNEISMKLIRGRPVDDDRKSELFVHINSKCQYQLSIRFSHQEAIGQLVRFHATTLPCFVVVIIILVLSYQLKRLRTNESLHDFIWNLSSYCKPFVVVPFVSIIRLAIKWEPLTSTYDITEMERKNMFFGTLPIVMFLFAYAVVCLVSQFLLYVTKCLGQFYSLLSRTPISDPSKPATGQTGIPWVLYSTIGVLITLASSTSGSLALVLGLCMSIAHVSKKYANVICVRNCMNLKKNVDSNDKNVSESKQSNLLEENQWDSSDETGEHQDSTPLNEEDKTAAKTERNPTVLEFAEDVYNYHFTLMMLLLCIVVINMPSLIVWAKHLKYSYSLPTDPAKFTSLAVCSSLAVLLDPNKSLPSNMFFAKFTSRLTYIFTIVMVLYTIESVYRLSYFISATFVIAAAIQL